MYSLNHKSATISMFSNDQDQLNLSPIKAISPIHQPNDPNTLTKLNFNSISLTSKKIYKIEQIKLFLAT